MTLRTQCSVEVQRLVRGLLLQGYSAGQIYKRLETLRDENPKDLGAEGHLPSKRTIERLVDQMRPHDLSGPWAFLGATPDQQRLVPEVLSHVFYETQGRVRLSNELAELVTQVRLSCPDIPLDWAYRYANKFQIAKHDPEREWSVILTLGLRLWERGENGLDLVEQLEEVELDSARWDRYFEEHGEEAILVHLQKAEYLNALSR